jgi:hypothetical protein
MVQIFSNPVKPILFWTAIGNVHHLAYHSPLVVEVAVVVVAVVVVAVVVDMGIKKTSIAAMPVPRRIRASRDRIKHTGERRQQLWLRYLCKTFSKFNKKKIQTTIYCFSLFPFDSWSCISLRSAAFDHEPGSCINLKHEYRQKKKNK